MINSTLSKLKTFVCEKIELRKQRHVTGWEKIFARHLTKDWGLGYIKNFYNSIKKIKQRTNTSQRYTDGQLDMRKLPQIISHHGHENLKSYKVLTCTHGSN